MTSTVNSGLPGHGCALHPLVSALLPLHFLPPFLAGASSTLRLVWMPVPHDAEHGSQSPKSDHTQFSGTRNE